MAQTVLLKVRMPCQGCAGAVTRVLTSLEGVESFNVDIETQKVTVITNLDPQFVLDKVSKTGKNTEFWKDEQVPAAPAPAAPAVEAATETVTVVTIDTAALSASMENTDAPKDTVEIPPAVDRPAAPATTEAAPTATPASA